MVAEGTCSVRRGRRGVTGDNFCVGECADVTDECFFCGDFAVVNHLVELHACCNAGEEAAFVDGCKCVVVVVKVFGVCLGAGCVAELNFGNSFAAWIM